MKIMENVWGGLITGGMELLEARERTFSNKRLQVYMHL